MNATVANRAHTLGIEVEPGDYGYARLSVGDVDGAREWYSAQMAAGECAYFTGGAFELYRPLAWRNGWMAASNSRGIPHWSDKPAYQTEEVA